MRFGLLTTFAIILFLPVGASAQTLGGLGSTDSFSISVNPQYPTPFNPATLSFLSSSIDLNNAILTVLANGKKIYRGSVRPISVMLGKAGSATTIKVNISSAGIVYTQSLVLQPQEVSLIVEPISSVPALYPGKPSVSLEGNSRIVAIANVVDASGKIIDPATLSYSWTVEGTQIANSSGIGKSTIVVASPLQYRERAVSVIVQSQVGNLVGSDSLSLVPVEPRIRLYENDPLLGIRFDRALSDSYTISGTESSLYAALFSMPLSGNSPLIQWFLNGSIAQTGPIITLRPAGSGKGNASLSLTASGSESVLATTNLSLSFGPKSSTNFFGL